MNLPKFFTTEDSNPVYKIGSTGKSDQSMLQEQIADGQVT